MEQETPSHLATLLKVCYCILYHLYECSNNTTSHRAVFFSSEYTYRLSPEDGVGLPSIPVHPIGFHDAIHLLKYNSLGF